MIKTVGLTEIEVITNRKKFGANSIKANKLSAVHLFVRQIQSNPLLIILSVSTIAAYIFDDKVSAAYIFFMIVVSVVLGFWNEYSAEKIVDGLLNRISHKVFVLRDDRKYEIDTTELVVGDVVFLISGDIVPADLKVTESTNFEVNESVLTGESVPVIKRINDSSFMGTIVLSGSAQGVVMAVGKSTQYGKIAKNTSFVKPETQFQQGLTKFGNLLIKVIVILTVSMFVVGVLLGKPLLSGLLFSLAIAVGLTPELLPVIVTISLSHGAGKLAKLHVISKQLVSIENLGNMDILCTDKTGTLTEGKIMLTDTFAPGGHDILMYSLLCNAADVAHKISGNPIDVSIWEYAQKHAIHLPANTQKVLDNPFDYDEMASFSVAKIAGKTQFISKGAPEKIISFCTGVNAVEVLEKFKELSNRGFRVIALAKKDINFKEKYTWLDATKMEFIGFLCFMDIPKKSAKQALLQLKNLNVSVKVLTGDNEIVTKRICEEVGLENKDIILGSGLDNMSDDEILETIQTVDIFARVNPEQKLRIINVLKRGGHTVGYLGDGVNDVPSLHTADVGISVDTAVDVAKEAANIIILKKGLDVIANGVLEGRKTFNNTIKYILMSTSSNFGNMFSAAGASFFLPFLPMTPTQILLNNSLYDMSQMAIPSDSVDPESLQKPKHWNISFIKNYMMFFGPISSLYDFLTFFILYRVFHAGHALFQTGWFIESLSTQVLVVLVIRTSRTPFFKSHVGRKLLITTLFIVAVGIVIPFLPGLSYSLGFVRPPATFFAVLIGLVFSYLALVEFMKKLFLKRFPL